MIFTAPFLRTADQEEGEQRMFHGLPIIIENEKGSVREGVNADGKTWERLMHCDYGYIPDTEGAGDKEGLDVYIGDDKNSPYAYIVEQLDDEGQFDEYKVLLGFPDLTSAEEMYDKHYPAGWGEEHVGEIWEVPLSTLSKGVKHEQQKEDQKYGSTKWGLRYHGTTVENAKSILKNGLKPSGKPLLKGEPPSDRVYAVDTKADAIVYGLMQSKSDTCAVVVIRNRVGFPINETFGYQGMVPPSDIVRVEIYERPKDKDWGPTESNEHPKLPKLLKILKPEQQKEDQKHGSVDLQADPSKVSIQQTGTGQYTFKHEGVDGYLTAINTSKNPKKQGLMVVESLIEESFRGKGYGKALYQAALNAARKAGYAEFCSEPLPLVSEDAKHIWQSLGAVISKKQGEEAYRIDISGMPKTSFDAVKEFLRSYDFEFYEQVAEEVRETLEDLLNDAGIRALVTCRAKKVKSLRRKLERRAPDKNYQNLIDIQKDIKDLSGVRVALYFPNDRAAVEQLIAANFEQARPPKHFPEEREPQDSDHYVATHYTIWWEKTVVEIQVASLLMQAWSEVAHDMVYKPLVGELSPLELNIIGELSDLIGIGEATLEDLQTEYEERAGKKLRFELVSALQKKLGALKYKQRDRDVVFFRQRLGSAQLYQNKIQEAWHIVSSENMRRIAATGQYFYHSTLSKNLNSIAKEGLKPSTNPQWGGELADFSMGKLLLNPTPKGAMYYGLQLFYRYLQNQEVSYIPLCLRVRIDNEELFEDKQSIGGDVWTDATISPNRIEVWWQDKWQPLKSNNWWSEFEYHQQEDGTWTDWEGTLFNNIPDVERDVKSFVLPKAA
jgi:ppGpp synthetase/RelA/SpoT-type nucleotidyltranferase/predicted GNAT family acetyltransferase